MGISSGRKTFDLRLYDEKRKLITPGDIIVFTNTVFPESTISARVLKLHIFSSFAELYKKLPLGQCGYLPNELNNANPKDMESYYSPAQQAQYAVVGIEL